MNVLLVGAGVVGTVYGIQLKTAGHSVDVLAHGARTEQIAMLGLRSRETTTNTSQQVTVRLVPDAAAEKYDLVLVAVWAGELGSVLESLGSLVGSPVVLVFGNNPAAQRGSSDMTGLVRLGFPGIGGTLADDTVEYMRIPQQPTTLEEGGDGPVSEFESALSSAGFPVSRTTEMAGWLAYHAVFLGSIAAALTRCNGSAGELAANRAVVRLMCRSIEEGFQALSRQGVRGLPGNLRTLHQPGLRIFARWYWARTMRSPMGERCFAAHVRHATAEMALLEQAAVDRVGDDPCAGHLRLLLAPV